MEYSSEQISEIKSLIIAKVRRDIEIAEVNNDIDKLILDYNISFEQEMKFTNTRVSKILILGDLAGKSDNYKIAIKKMGINLKNVEFCNDYQKIKRFDLKKLEYSTVYSDIIIGPIPHKVVNLGENSSLVAKLEKEPEKYPKVIRAEANSKLKITINSLESCIKKTRYFQQLSSEY